MTDDRTESHENEGSPGIGGPWQILPQTADAQRVRRREDYLLLILTLVIGAIVGVVVVAFILLTESLGSRMYPAGGAAWRRLVVPLLGALITGFFLKRYFPNARGSGIPQTKTAMFLRGGVIRIRTVLGKFGLSSVSLASGIALGREGPSPRRFPKIIWQLAPLDIRVPELHDSTIRNLSFGRVSSCTT